MHKTMKLLSIVLLIFLVNCNAEDLPSYFSKCNIDDDNLNDCILNAANNLKPQIRNGVKEIRLPSFDPLIIKTFGLFQDYNSFRNNVTFSNFVARGFDSYKFEELRYDPNTLILNGSVRFGKMHVVTDYDIRSWFFYFPIVGKGLVNVGYDSVNGTFEVKGKLIKRKSATHYFPTSTAVRIKINGFYPHFSSLFEGNPELTHLTNEVVNLNGQRIIDTATPTLEKVAEELLLRFMRTFTKLVPYAKIFPPSHS